jgi:hypothetical protein
MFNCRKQAKKMESLHLGRCKQNISLKSRKNWQLLTGINLYKKNYYAVALYCIYFKQYVFSRMRILNGATRLSFVSFFCRLNYVIVRPALVYGLGDKQGLSKS